MNTTHTKPSEGSLSLNAFLAGAFFWGTALVCALLVSLPSVVRALEAPPAASPQAVAPVTATLTERSLIHEAFGTIQPKIISTLSSKVMGNVLEVLKREGDMVKENEVVVKIDARDLASDLAGARAGLSEASASLSELERNRQVALAQKEQIESGLKLAESTFQRISSMYEKKSVSQQELDQAQNSLNAARSQLKQADAQIASIDASRSRISARMSQAQAGVSKVETIRNLATVMAPFPGRVTARKIEPGMLAAPGVPLLVIEDDSHLRFEAIVPEGLIASVTEGQMIPVSIDALAGETFEGTVAEIAPAADPLSHTFLVKIAIPTHPRLRSGMYARGKFTIGSETTLLVPRTAVENRGQLDGVYVPGESGRPVYRLIRLGRILGDQIEVLAGIKAGERFYPLIPQVAERK